jgi:hypothetical protein
MFSRQLLVLAGIGLAFGLITFSFPFVLPIDTMAALIREDSSVEYIQPLFFLIASILFFATFLVVKTGNQIGPIRIPRNIFLLGLAALLFFGAGEEISWGQRLLGFETPETMSENIQGETTLHNLPMFDPTNEESLLNMNRLFTIFWFILCVLIPTVAFYAPVRRLLLQWGMPIVPYLIGYQFLLYYVLSKLYEPLGVLHDVYNGRHVELRESQHALLFVLVAFYLFTQARKHKRLNPELV